MMSVRERQNRRADSTPSFSSFDWKAGRNSLRLVLALMLSITRQMTSATPATDMKNIGQKKYQSWVTNFRNADMGLSQHAPRQWSYPTSSCTAHTARTQRVDADGS